MKSLYKLLYVENKDYDYDHYGHSELILKDASSWTELEDEEAKNLLYYIQDRNKLTYPSKYVLIRDVQNEINEFLLGGIEKGKEIKRKEEERQRKNEEKKLKAQKTMEKNKKKKEEEALEKAKKLLKAKGYAI